MSNPKRTRKEIREAIKKIKTKSDEVNTITPTNKKMENLTTNNYTVGRGKFMQSTIGFEIEFNELISLQGELEECGLILDAGDNIRVSKFIGELKGDQSFEDQLDATFSFSDRIIQKILLPMERNNQMTKSFSTGVLSLTFPKTHFTPKFLMEHSTKESDISKWCANKSDGQCF